MDTKKDIKSLNLEELKTELESMGEKAFRAKQMYEWMHVKLVRSFDEMTNLSAKFREQCKEKYEYTCVNPVRIQESKIDGTKKFLFELSDGNVVETPKEKIRALSALMKTQTGKDFEFNEKLVSIVSVIRIDCDYYTAKHRPLPGAE